MSATDELRRMLDERGIHWWEGQDEHMTLWKSNGLTWEYFNNENADAWLGFLSAYEQDITPEQAIVATLGGGTLTAEHVREAIFGNSSYASYDGAKYYADGIGMQAIADELNTRAERTCKQVNVAGYSFRFECSACGYVAIVHNCAVRLDELPNYCPKCGARVERGDV